MLSLGNKSNRPYLYIKNIFKSTVFSISTKAVSRRTLTAPDHVGFVLDKGAWGGADYSPITRYFPANNNSPMFDTHLINHSVHSYITGMKC